MKKKARSSALVLRTLLCAAFCGPNLQAIAGEWRVESLPSTTIHAKVWQTQGQTKVAHDSSKLSALFGSPTSVLEYKNVDSTVLELGARVDLKLGWFIEANVGSGTLDNGDLIDDDFVSTAGADFLNTTVSGPHMVSRTFSEINNDDLLYVNLLFGRNVFTSKSNRVKVGLFGQAQHWEEAYTAQGLTQAVCTSPNNFCAPTGSSGFRGMDVISNKVRWQTVSLGVDTSIAVGKRIELNGRVTASPFAQLRNDDTHHLRPDLNQNPSFRDEGTGTGYGIDLDASYHFTPRLSAHAGYRYWKMEIKDEVNGQLAFPAGSSLPVASDLDLFVTKRQGFLLGIKYRFGGGTSTAAAAK